MKDEGGQPGVPGLGFGRLHEAAELAGSTVGLWRVRFREHRLRHSQRRSPSIAAGLAWRGASIGGVRRHLECLQRHSRFSIALYPSVYACGTLSPAAMWRYSHGLTYERLRSHALFHSHVDPAFVDVCRSAQADGKPWIHTYHTLYFAEDWGGKLEPWQARINDGLLKDARSADTCIAVGSWLVERLWQEFEIRATYIPNGVDVDACDAARASRFVRRYGLSNYVAFVGNISRIKDPAAFIRLARNLPKLRFAMIGSGLTAERMRKELSIDIPGNLAALGPLPHDATLDAIAACDALVMTSLREGLPTALLEAMAMEKPCVVPGTPYFADAVADPSHGFAYELGKDESLREATLAALENGGNPAARRHVRERFAWPIVAAQHDLLYRQLLAAAQSRPPGEPSVPARSQPAESGADRPPPSRKSVRTSGRRQ